VACSRIDNWQGKTELLRGKQANTSKRDGDGSTAASERLDCRGLTEISCIESKVAKTNVNINRLWATLFNWEAQ
jgi:hypothetical protein